jgi:hypothetical protein
MQWLFIVLRCDCTKYQHKLLSYRRIRVWVIECWKDTFQILQEADILYTFETDIQGVVILLCTVLLM